MNVYILLDRSGSMATLWNEAIGSINGYVAKLKKTDKVHLAVFDSVSHDVLRDVKVKDWTDVSEKEVEPRGGTPLYDSCGKVMAVAEKDNAKKTVLVVMTDGYENASHEHTQASIKAKVKAFEDKKWEVIFLGANFDAVESVSGAIGVVGSKTLNYGAGNFARGMATLASATTMYSTQDCAINFTNEDKAKLSTSTL
jgi:uncharacterized protein with von Willebrand factor type A (vWA) domain